MGRRSYSTPAKQKSTAIFTQQVIPNSDGEPSLSGDVKLSADDQQKSLKKWTPALRKQALQKNRTALKNKAIVQIAFWLPDKDSNLDKKSQNLLCYRYTIGQAAPPSQKRIFLSIETRAVSHYTRAHQMWALWSV